MTGSHGAPHPQTLSKSIRGIPGVKVLGKHKWHLGYRNAVLQSRTMVERPAQRSLVDVELHAPYYTDSTSEPSRDLLAKSTFNASSRSCGFGAEIGPQINYSTILTTFPVFIITL